MLGKGMIKKVMMYLIMGPMGLLLGGGFSLMDFFLIPMIAPMFSGMFGGMGLGGATPASAGATT